MICEKEVEFGHEKKFKSTKKSFGDRDFSRFCISRDAELCCNNNQHSSKHTAQKATVLSSTKTGGKVSKLAKTNKTSKSASKKFSLRKKKTATSKSATSVKSTVKAAGK